MVLIWFQILLGLFQEKGHGGVSWNIYMDCTIKKDKIVLVVPPFLSPPNTFFPGTALITDIENTNSPNTKLKKKSNTCKHLLIEVTHALFAFSFTVYSWNNECLCLKYFFPCCLYFDRIYCCFETVKTCLVKDTMWLFFEHFPSTGTYYRHSNFVHSEVTGCACDYLQGTSLLTGGVLSTQDPSPLIELICNKFLIVVIFISNLTPICL